MRQGSFSIIKEQVFSLKLLTVYEDNFIRNITANTYPTEMTQSQKFGPISL